MAETVVAPAAPAVAPAAPEVKPPTVEPKLIQVPEAEWKKVTESIEQIPGMVKRMVKESIPAAPVVEPPKATQKEEAWTTEINRLKSDLAAKDAEVALRSAVTKKQWFDADENVGELLPKVKLVDGKYVVPGKRQIGNQEIDDNLTLDEAVEQLATRKPWRVKVHVQSGTGASGASANGTGTARPTYQQLIGDPKLLKEWSDKDPEYVRTIQDEGLAQIRKGK